MRSMTPTFVQWLNRAEESEDEKIRVLIESQRILLQSVRALIGSSNSLTYQIEDGARVTLYSEDGESFSLEFLGDDAADTSATQLYDLYFPTKDEQEPSSRYHERLLEGIDSFIDALARGQVLSMDRT